MTVQIDSVSLTYQTRNGEVPALRDVSFSVSEGEFVSLVGPSGCGKSTLLSLIAGLETPTQGQILLYGEAVSAPSQKVALMPQKDELFPWRSIWGNVTLPLELRGIKGGAHTERLRSMLTEYGLGDFLSSSPNALSGGMRQRCALIRTLAADPEILLLDEPFSALDYQTRLTVSADIRAIIRREKKTALLVTHDISESIALSDRIVVLSPRPASVRNIHVLPPELLPLDPPARRNHPAFAPLFNEIWKELGMDA